MKDFVTRFGLGVIVLSVLIVLVAYVAVTMNKDVEVIPEGIPVEMEEKDLPELEEDKDPVVAAMESKDINYCEYVDDETRKEACKKSVFNSRVFEKAMESYNPELCNEISNERAKESCILIAQSGKDHVGNMDSEYLGHKSLAAGDVDLAIEQFENTISEGSADYDVYASISIAYAEKALKEQEKGNDRTVYLEKAFENIEKAKALEPSNSEVYRVQGYINEIVPDYPKAIESYNKAIELDDRNIDAYAGRGHTNRLIGALPMALSDFETAAELDTDNSNIFVYANLCNLENVFGRVEDSIKYCEMVINIDSEHTAFKLEAYMNLAENHLNNKDYDKAENFLLNAESISSKDSNLYATFAKLYNYKGEFEKSEEKAKRAIELSPTKVFGYEMLSYSYYLQEKFEESISQSLKGLDLVEDDVSLLEGSKLNQELRFYFLLSDSYERIGDNENKDKYRSLAESLNSQAGEI